MKRTLILLSPLEQEVDQILNKIESITILEYSPKLWATRAI